MQKAEGNNQVYSECMATGYMQQGKVTVAGHEATHDLSERVITQAE